MEIGSAGWVRKPIVISNQVVSVVLIENVTPEQRHNGGEIQPYSYPEVSILGRGISQYQRKLQARVYLAQLRKSRKASAQSGISYEGN